MSQLEQFESIVTEYGPEGEAYFIDADEDGNIILQTRVIHRRLFMQLAAFCDRRHWKCYVVALSDASLKFVAYNPYSNVNQEP